jgi:hypothetical protein
MLLQQTRWRIDENQLFLPAIERGDGHHYILMVVITGESHVSRERVEPLRHHVTG